ncbi:MAG: nucleoside-diphosphate sugar epimerase/dehydratase [Tissierellia bacterium]|nr:nucleoside-diphosphate sugar epimerase/dehydratase [Tissierellia bacterium]
MKKKKLLLQVVLDALLINLIYLAALNLRFEWHIPDFYMNTYVKYALVITVLKIGVYFTFSLYRMILRYASVHEMLSILAAIFTSNVLASGFLMLIHSAFPRSIYPIVTILDMLLIGGIRFIPKIARTRQTLKTDQTPYKNTLIVGAGESGIMVLNELRRHQDLGNMPIAFVDDDAEKQGKLIRGVKVLGDRHSIPDLVKDLKIAEIIVAMPSVKSDDEREILEICNSTSVKVRIVPGVYEMIDAPIKVEDIRDLSIEDLLGREEVHLNIGELQAFIEGKTIMVTGGGGSIGSELVRQIAVYKPARILVLDIYENSVYGLQNEMKRNYPNLDLIVLIESVRDRERIDKLLGTYHPHIIFHAAAHKHVPLMEKSPESAVKNNVFGTLNMVLEADRHGVEKFVLISTDKAVNPTNVMGATKRICELIIQSYNPIAKTDYVAVRFGNVLGSAGSVIPLFLDQIKGGGPVTVTDREIIRYFMSIPEAAQLVLQAGAIAKGGEVFILDMGEPVRILDLAEKLIRLSGYRPYEDMKIEFIGLRDGEKQFEELLINEDLADRTDHERIYVEKPISLDFHELELSLVPLLESTKLHDRDAVIRELEKIVPTFDNYVPDRDKDGH